MGEIRVKKGDTHDTPSTGYSKIYPKLDGKWYYKNPDGTETLIGGFDVDSPIAYLRFDTTSGDPDTLLEGMVWWNAQDKTLNIKTASETIYQVGQEIAPKFRNSTGEDLLNGTPVYVDGATGQIATIAKASAADSSAHRTLAVVTEDIADNGTGCATMIGLVRDLDTSAFNDGDILYLGVTPGTLTNVEPSVPNHTVMVGICTYSHNSLGHILVNINMGKLLEDIKDVDVSGVADGMFLKYDAATKKWTATPRVHNTLGSIQGGTTDEYYHLTSTQHTDLTDGGESTLHYHSSDRNRANHTGTQVAATISDFDTEVANNSAVVTNTAKVSADGSIDTHSDVDTTTSAPTNGQALVWDGSNWVPDDVTAGSTAWGSITGTLSNQTDLQNELDAKVSADGSIDTHNDVDTTTAAPTSGQALVWDGSNWVPDDVGGGSGLPAGADTQIQYNNSGAFGASANLTYDGALNVKGTGTTSATNTLALTNSSDVNLLTMNDDGTFNGKNLAMGEYTGATRIGDGAAVNATGSNWTAIGTNACQNKTTGNNWTAIGTNAGQSNTTTGFWTGIGYNAGVSNTTGAGWTAIGTNAGQGNTTGSNWTAIGNSAGISNTTGGFWTAIGRDAGRSNTTGSDWVAIGLNAGRYIKGTTTALQFFQNSTYIGTTTKGTNGTDVSPTDNETVIGYAAEGNGSNTVTIGNSSVTDQYLKGMVHSDGCYAEIHVHDASAAQSIPTGTTYTKLTSFADNGFSSNCTPDATNNKITFTKTGIYKVSCSMNFSSGTANTVFWIAPFLNGVEQDHIHIKRKISASGDVGSATMVGIIDVTSTSIDLDIRARHDNGSAVNLTIEYSNLTVEYLGET